MPLATLSKLLLLWSLLIAPVGHKVHGVATTFWNGEKFNPGGNSCYLRAPGITQELDDSSFVFASKSLKCGQYAIFKNPRTGLSAIGRKADWGPVVGMVDLSLALTEALGTNGKEPVIMMPIRKKR